MHANASCEAARYRVRWPKIRAGNISRALSNANTASKVMPIRRNGKDSNQNTGHNSSASKAIGQLTTNKMHQPIKSSRNLMTDPSSVNGEEQDQRSRPHLDDVPSILFVARRG